MTQSLPSDKKKESRFFLVSSQTYLCVAMLSLSPYHFPLPVMKGSESDVFSRLSV